MASDPTALPTSVTGQHITGGYIGITGGPDFYIIAESARIRVVNPWQQVTADGHGGVSSWRASNVVYLDIWLRGFMAAGSTQVFQLANIFNPATNPTAGTSKFLMDSSQVLTCPKILIGSCDISYRMGGPVVGLAMHMRVTDTMPTWGAS